MVGTGGIRNDRDPRVRRHDLERRQSLAEEGSPRDRAGIGESAERDSYDERERPVEDVQHRTLDQPVAISVWVEDPKVAGERGRGGFLGTPSVATVSLHKFRGPGKVTFEKPRLPVAKQGDMVSTNATFSAAGDYLLRVQANDESGEGGGGFQCCWTNTYVKVTIK